MRADDPPAPAADFRYERALFFGVPAVVLVAAFIGVCVVAGTAWPWSRVVHEDGIRTLLGTIFYFEHATRELVPDLVLALAVAGSVRFFFPPTAAAGSVDASRWRRRLWAWTAASVILILAGTVATVGAGAIVDNLEQLHTREGAALVWGAHWRYHLIERFAQILLAFAVSGVVWMIHRRPEPGTGPRRRTLLIAAWVAFAGFTLLFRPTMEPFREPTFLGHQIRELFTHTLVTLPLALGVCFAMARRFSRTSTEARSAWPIWPIILSAVVSVAAGAYLLVASILTDARSHGQQSGLGRLLFPHFFEHTLGYVMVAALAGALYLWAPPSTQQ